MRPEPAFEAPWHAQVFAVTVALSEAGHFSWTDWAQRFGAALAQAGLDRALNGGDDYFDAWLLTLEEFLADLKLADPADTARIKAAWARAYLRTPHGQPVHLDA